MAYLTVNTVSVSFLSLWTTIEQFKTMPICPLTVPVGSPGFLNSESHKTEIQVLAARAAVSPECRGPFLSAPVVGRTQFLAAVGLSPSAS